MGVERSFLEDHPFPENALGELFLCVMYINTLRQVRTVNVVSKERRN